MDITVGLIAGLDGLPIIHSIESQEVVAIVPITGMSNFFATGKKQSPKSKISSSITTSNNFVGDFKIF